MALKKPSDLFNKEKTETSGVFQSPNISSHISESYDRFLNNFEKVNDLSQKVEELSCQLSEKLDRTDLENAMLSHLMVLDENFKLIQNEVKGINKQDLKEFKETVFNLNSVIENLVSNEIPKYKKQITRNELLIKNELNEVKDNLDETVVDIKSDIDTKFNNIANVIDNNIGYFNQQLEDTSLTVKKNTETYDKLSKILESRILRDNEKLQEYSDIIDSLQKTFLEFSNVLQEEILSYQQNIDEKIEIYKKEIVDSQQISEEKIENYKKEIKGVQTKLETSFKNTLEDYDQKIIDVKADLTINEQRIKNVDRYLERYHKDLIEIREEVFDEINKLPVGNLQENIERLESKIDYIKNTYSKINPENVVSEVINEGLLNEPPDVENSDPLTPLDKKFVTLDQLQEHYRLFLNRIQQQLSTLGGGGETRLKYLDDIVGIATNPIFYDGKYLRYDHATKKFIFSDVGEQSINISEKNIIYVAKDGNDLNPGSLSKPKLTIKAAIDQCPPETVIKVAPGTYYEDNPITVPDQISIIGHSLRETTVIPLNDDEDLFYIGNGNYIAEMSFKGSLTEKAVFAFDPIKSRYIDQSPYIQNCTNFIPDSIGMRIDGNDAIGPTKSMVLDSYTQYNQGGIGVSITNEGYAQLVSLFTICNDIAVYCGSGGACDLTNSNSSFGNYGLVADGVSPLKYTGSITQTTDKNSDTFVVNLNTPTKSVSNAVYDNITGIVTITTSTNHNFSVGMGVTISGLEFTCPSGPGIVTYPSGTYGNVFEIQSTPSPNQFSVNVGPSSLPHTYNNSGGTVKINISRPYDGQAVYFNELFYNVKLRIIDGGSGYTEPPTIIIDPPVVDWGVVAEAVAVIENGVLVGVDMISNGRGYKTIPEVYISAGINTAVVIAELVPEYYTIEKASEIIGNLSIITLNENVPFEVGIGTTVNFFKQSRILASGHSFEFIGSGTDIALCLPSRGGVTIENNETNSRNGGLVVYSSTNQSGDFKIGDGVTINQNTGSITGSAYTKSLFSTMTPYILSLGGL